MYIYVLLCVTVKKLNKSLPVGVHKAFSCDFVRAGGKQPNKTRNSMHGEKEGNAEENKYDLHFWKPQHTNLK